MAIKKPARRIGFFIAQPPPLIPSIDRPSNPYNNPQNLAVTAFRG